MEGACFSLIILAERQAEPVVPALGELKYQTKNGKDTNSQGNIY